MSSYFPDIYLIAPVCLVFNNSDAFEQLLLVKDMYI